MGVSPPLLLDVLLFFSSGELLVLPGLVEDATGRRQALGPSLLFEG